MAVASFDLVIFYKSFLVSIISTAIFSAIDCWKLAFSLFMIPDNNKSFDLLNII